MEASHIAKLLNNLGQTELGGAKEASVFFYVAAGAMTPADVIELTKARAGATRVRFFNLVDKGLIERKKSHRGRMLYTLTRKGKTLVTKVIPE